MSVQPPSANDRLLIYHDVLRPAGIHSYIWCEIEFRKRPLSVIMFARHGEEPPFRARDNGIVCSLRTSLGLVEAALQASLRPYAANYTNLLRSRLGLSRREAEVAALIVRGLQEKEIASRLGTSPNTVHTQTRRIYEKTGVSGRMELVVRFKEWLTLDAPDNSG
jgi:DNA-binding CsgD family transcriptional regulator